MKRFLIFFFCSVFCVSYVYSGDALQITDLGSSASMIGMGRIEGFGRHAQVMFDNPAGLHSVSRYSIAAFSTYLMDEVTYRNLAIAMRSDWGVSGVGVMMAGVSDIPYTDKVDGTVIQTGSFVFENVLLKMGHQLSLSRDLSVAVNVSFFSNTIGHIYGRGWNVDLGALYDFKPFSFSFSVKNILTENKLSYLSSRDSVYTASESMPIQTTWGLCVDFGDIDLLTQFKTVSHYQKPLVAMAVMYEPGFLPFLSLYAGLSNYYQLQVLGEATTFGLRLILVGIQLDYAYERSDHISFDHHNYFSASVNF